MDKFLEAGLARVWDESRKRCTARSPNVYLKGRIMKVVKIKSSFTGGHFAIQSEQSSKPFTNPMSACKSVPLFENDVVVDIGAFVGEYSLYASRFANTVISYEAAPTTFEVLKQNQKPNMTIHNMAVVGDNRDSVKLYLSSGIGATNSIVKRKGRGVVVKAISYDEAVKDATVVKIDVEGAEYGYDIIKPNLRAIILEFHPVTSNLSGGLSLKWEKAYDIMQKLRHAGFEPACKVPKFRNGWDTNSAWIRT